MVKTDAELVKAVLDGEKQMFAELVKRYEKPVRAAALDILGDFHIADDISQDTFVRAYEKLASLRKPQAFGPWLLKIARRCSIESVRKNSRAANVAINTTAIRENPKSQLNEENQWLLAAVVKLPKAEKQVVMLHYFDRNGVRDVAKIVGRSVGTVTKQLSRARIRLRKVLERSEK